MLMARYLLRPSLGVLLLLMFAQQLIFFGYESLLGLFTLTRLGFLGRGNAALFIIIGIILVLVQLRYIGRWSAKLGDRGLVILALGLLALGLLLTGLTPDAPHPLYVRELVRRDLLAAAPYQNEAIIGELAIELPPNGKNSLAGVLWLAGALIPVSVGAGLIRPALNSLLTRRGDSWRVWQHPGRQRGTSKRGQRVRALDSRLDVSILWRERAFPAGRFADGGLVPVEQCGAAWRHYRL